ncbi:MAG: phosphodiester glycosidase family protein [Actinomycetota bacterium]|nr:phosphodiester glycosidase family protein [Actinomycetota bacterium]
MGPSSGHQWGLSHGHGQRLYSGSLSPGGGPYRFTAPIKPAQARDLVAAFNGGFMMPAAGGGYYTERRTVVPLRLGAASLVIYKNGSVAVGAWGSQVAMSRSVSSVRQNLTLLVARGRPTPLAGAANWLAWGATCGRYTCTGPGIENQWRSGVGVTADGALVYVTGPGLAPLQLAEILARAGVVTGMPLDINPDWTVFVTYNPSSPTGLAAPSNGTKLVASTVQGPWTFFESWWARDFVTMSAR